jgi:hypothetical protein
MTPDEWREQVISARASAETALQAAIRGESLCDISRKGVPGPANAKFAEGKWVAFREVEQLDPREDPRPIIERLSLAAQDERHEHRAANRGSDWIEYSEGRVAGFAELLELLLSTPAEVSLELPGDGLTAGLR